MQTLLAIARKFKNLILKDDPVERYRMAGVVIGQRAAILDEVIIDIPHAWLIEIGDDVTLAPRVHILAHDASTKRHLNYTRLGKVRIGSRVFIGTSSIVLPGVLIGDDVVIGAGSVVSHDVPSGSVAAGNPARVICSLENFLNRKRRQMERYPCFGREYAAGVTAARKDEMNAAMKDRYGFIV